MGLIQSIHCCFINQQYYNNKFYNHIKQSLILCLIYTNYNLSPQKLLKKKEKREIVKFLLDLNLLFINKTYTYMNMTLLLDFKKKKMTLLLDA